MSAWSLSLGRWGGIQIRLHALFLLFGVFTVYLSTRSPHADMVWYGGVVSLWILFIGVLLHELGHALAALRLGGHAEEIVLGPLGGLTQPSVPHEPRSELVVALAGPLVNLAVCLVTTLGLLLSGETNVLGLLNPLYPHSLADPPDFLPVFLKLTFWLNWLLVVVNLLPAYPFDGGRALRAVLWPVFGYRPSITVVARVAKATALMLCLVAWVMRDAFPTAPVPAWVPLVLIALLLWFSAKQDVARLDRQDFGDEPFGYDFSQGYTSLEREAESSAGAQPGVLRRWLRQRREQKERQRREQETAEESRVDDILARLHGRGLEGLSSEDRALLERVSARYRNRLKH